MNQVNFKFANGDRVKDNVSGFIGTITSQCNSIGRKVDYLVESVSKDGTEKPKNHWFFEDRLELIK